MLVAAVYLSCERYVAFTLAVLHKIVVLNLVAPSLFCRTGCSAVARRPCLLICVDIYPQTVAVPVWLCDRLVLVGPSDLSHLGCVLPVVCLQFSSVVKNCHVCFSLIL